MAQPNINNAVHVYNLTDGLNEQRKKGLFSDIILKVGGQSLSAHSCVLSACSPYFQSLITKYSGRPSTDGTGLTLKLDEPGMIGPLVGLKKGGYEAMSCLLDYMYTGKIYWNEENVNLIVQLADAVMLDELANMGRAYINAVKPKSQVEDINNVSTSYISGNVLKKCDQLVSAELTSDVTSLKCKKRVKLLKRHVTKLQGKVSTTSSDEQSHHQLPELFIPSKFPGNKPLSCRICRRSFRWEHSLKAHLRLHAKMNYYQCKHCEYRTIHKSSFQNHQNASKCSIAKTNKSKSVKQTSV
ncbi:hypothetical protein CHUAL_013530 [Chamberlinius hualienensis]